MLAALLEPGPAGAPGDSDHGDVARVLARFGRDRERLRAGVERTLQRLKSGNSGRPVFAEALFRWFENAWLLASVEHGAARLRTGALLLELVADTGRYTAETYPELESIAADELRREIVDLVGPSPESLEAAPEAAGASGATAGPGSGKPAAGRVPGEALARFTTSFSERARRGELDRIFGRDREIRQLVDILSRRKKNNPIVVGDPGVGKTALVEGLAQAIVDGQVPADLAKVELLGLDLALLQAGASVRGEFENRLKAVIAEVKASPVPIVLFIDEAHTLVGAGGAQGTGDAANLLKPALARGELRTIAATTWAEYKKYFEKDAALERRFQPVKVDEPSTDDAVLMLRGVRPVLEKAHGVVIRDEAVEAAVELSSRYLSGRQLPDKAVDLLDTTAARVRVEGHARPESLVDLESRHAGLVRQREVLGRDHADGAPVEAAELAELDVQIAGLAAQIAELTARFTGERDAVLAVRTAREALAALPADAPADAIERARATLRETQAALATRRGADGDSEPLVHLDVDADAVARVVSGWTGIPAGRMQQGLISAALALEERLRARVRGQEAAIRTVAETIRIAHAGIRDPRTPIGVLLFVGTSGVGKTETATALADTLYGGERFMTTINMSEFQEKHSVSRLIGSPPGYVGFGEGGLLTEAVRQRPYSVVLLDECEKADLEVMNLFYQVFDKGTLNDGEGRATDFRHTVVILTSNLGTEELSRLADGSDGDGAPTSEAMVAAVRPVLSKHFKPALLARMTIVPFAPLSRPVMREIASMKLDALARRLRDAHGTELVFEPALVDELTRRCTVAETGARTVDHILRGSLMPELARLVLERLAAGAPPRAIDVGLAPDGGWRIETGD